MPRCGRVGPCVRDGDRRPAAVHSKGSQPPTCPCACALRVDVTHFRCFVSGGKELCGLTGGRGGRLLTVAPPTWSAFYEEVCVRRLVFSLAGRGARASVPPRGGSQRPPAGRGWPLHGHRPTIPG